MNIKHPVSGEILQIDISELVAPFTHTIDDDLSVSVSVKSKSAPKNYTDKEWLSEKYLEQGLSMSAIASMCGVSAMTIHMWLKKQGIATRPRGRPKANSD